MTDDRTTRRLRAPLRAELRPALSEASVQRMWRAIAAKRTRPPRPAARAITAALVLAAAALLALLVWRAPRSGADGARSGALALAGGAEIGVLQVAAAAPAPAAFELSDGSTIVLSPGTRLSTLESTDRVFSALVSAGRIELDVKKGGPRRWSIECGVATVDVIGTRLLIERSATRVSVQVFEGTVLVRGERVPERIQRLSSGQSIEIDDTREQARGGAAASAPLPGGPAREDASPTEAPANKSVNATTTARAPAVSWHELARRGDYRGAYQALGTQGIRRESAHGGVEELLALADMARLSGHPEDAAIPLARIVRDHAGDPRSALAAFTLGKLQLDTLGQPAQAAASFQTALGLGLSTPLVEDALARIVEAHARSGNDVAARAAAAEYERRFPHGRRLEDARRWVNRP
jgi:transmembrane sensor